MTAGEALHSIVTGAGIGALLALGWLAVDAIIQAFRRWSLRGPTRRWLREIRRSTRPRRY